MDWGGIVVHSFLLVIGVSKLGRRGLNVGLSFWLMFFGYLAEAPTNSFWWARVTRSTLPHE
ncbi:hypothetical protein PanWU01x14_151690 [Parasponia andersonii]|uniref:Uncharacterized protein n=1 Tax=Parasponia andersonii TaxID=3476 RepID=A0A2P5CHP9_PARAD|nr:hypothetical protein PanWU01x14_151690 [Parasponia andersonii]